MPMLGIGTFIRRFKSPVQAELVLMNHFASKQKTIRGWDRRYAHMQFVLKWGPVFRRHANPLQQGQSSPTGDSRSAAA